MSLSASTLGNLTAGSMNQADNAAEAHTRLCNAIKGHVLDNIELAGTYTGLLPNGSPDPSNGSYKWEASSFNISAEAVKSGAEGGLSGFANALKAECAKVTFTGSDKNNIITIGSVTLTINSLSIDMSSKPDNMEEAHQKVAVGIISGLTGAITSPSSISGASTSGGTGTVVFGAIS